MTRENFVQGISVAVQAAGVRATLQDLRDAGSLASPWRTDLSAWFNQLPEKEAEMVNRAVRLAVDVSVFGFLCVLDGVRVIEQGEDKGEIKLTYTKHGEEVRLNGWDGGLDLHDIFQDYIRTL